jgi:hypothetical protein
MVTLRDTVRAIERAGAHYLTRRDLIDRLSDGEAAGQIAWAANVCARVRP